MRPYGCAWLRRTGALPADYPAWTGWSVIVAEPVNSCHIVDVDLDVCWSASRSARCVYGPIGPCTRGGGCHDAGRMLLGERRSRAARASRAAAAAPVDRRSLRTSRGGMLAAV